MSDDDDRQSVDSSTSDDSVPEHPYIPLVTDEESLSTKCRKMEQRFKIVNAQKVCSHPFLYECKKEFNILLKGLFAFFTKSQMSSLIPFSYLITLNFKPHPAAD